MSKRKNYYEDLYMSSDEEDEEIKPDYLEGEILYRYLIINIYYHKTKTISYIDEDKPNYNLYKNIMIMDYNPVKKFIMCIDI